MGGGCEEKVKVGDKCSTHRCCGRPLHRRLWRATNASGRERQRVGGAGAMNGSDNEMDSRLTVQVRHHLSRLLLRRLVGRGLREDEQVEVDELAPGRARDVADLASPAGREPNGLTAPVPTAAVS